MYLFASRRKNHIVIDPYAGSGTTLLAAQLLGHNYIGIETSEEYIAIAEKRLENAVSEMKVFNDEVSKHIVHKTFEERKKNNEFTGKHKPSVVKADLFNQDN